MCYESGCAGVGRELGDGCDSKEGALVGDWYSVRRRSICEGLLRMRRSWGRGIRRSCRLWLGIAKWEGMGGRFY